MHFTALWRSLKYRGGARDLGGRGQAARNLCLATRPLIEDLKELSFPTDWTIAVACTQAVWKSLQQKGDAFGTNTAYTNLRGRITILHGAIYVYPLPLRGTTRRSPKNVLRHEFGHIVCHCGDEQSGPCR